MVEKMITGSLVQSYFICNRQLWYMSRQILPEQDHVYIEIGRLIDEESFQRNKKQINFENVVLDFINSDEGEFVVGEVKKSSKAEKGARMQLLYYLYRLKLRGIEAKGILSFPKEKKRYNIELDEEAKKELEELFEKIKSIIFQQRPPELKKSNYCNKCGYKGMCWA